MVSTVMVKIRAICEDFFQKYDEKDRIYQFSSPKVLRLLEILRQFKPDKLPEEKSEEGDSVRLESGNSCNCIKEKVNYELPGNDNAKVLSTKETEITDEKKENSNHCECKIDNIQCGCEIKTESVNDIEINNAIQASESVPTELNNKAANCSNDDSVDADDSIKCSCIHNSTVKEDDDDNKSICTQSGLESVKGNSEAHVKSLEECKSVITFNKYSNLSKFTEVDTNKDDNLPVIDSSIHKDIRDECSKDCDKTEIGKMKNEIVKELKNNEIRSTPENPSRSPPDFYQRNRGYRFSRRGFQREDGVGSARGGRNDNVGRQYRNPQQDDVDALLLEEGIDVPKCNLVIHFNVPQVYRSYVQSKGRARAQDAYYILMIEEDRSKQFVNDLAQYFEIEQMLLRKCANREPTEEEESEADKYTDLIPSYCPSDSPNSPSVNMATAVALVNRYCAKLPSDTFTRLTPMWNVKTTSDNGLISFICTVRLPINSPVKQDIVGLPMPSRVLARRIAALETCKVLHKTQELDDNLMPVGKESFRVHEEEETTLALEELEEMVPRDSTEPRPGTTKRRQYYYKRVNCRPIPGQPAYLYHISMVLTCPLPEEQNTRGRKIYPPEDSPQGFGILTLKQIPKICPFPIFTRSGEVRVKLELSGSDVVLTPDKLEKIVTFLNYTFTSVLRLQKYLMMFDPQASENSYFIVPTRKFDWDFLDRIYENRDLRPRPVPEEERAGFTFEATKYHDAVIMPWYRNQDQPQYFYVAEICGHLNPKSTFPGSEYKTFDEYYFKKYNIQIQNSKQPLLDVDHTSARLNFLTPRYVNRKGVALPTSSEETKRAKRENLEQKQILVPELCTVHPFPASLWRKAVCLPCILYRINALLLADQIRRHVAFSIALGHENLKSDFEWAPLDFGWSLADVLKKSKENAKNAEQNKENKDKKIEEIKPEDGGIQNKASEEEETKEKSANKILTEEEKKLRGDWMEIGTWSNDMANHGPMSVSLPSNLTMVDENAELAGLHSGGSDWGTGIQARRGRERVRYGSPSSWLSGGGYFGGLEQDLEGFETDDSSSEPGNDYDQSDSSDIQKREKRHATMRQNSENSGSDDQMQWDWEDDTTEDIDKFTEKYVEQFRKATEKNQEIIENNGTLIRNNQPIVIVRKCSQQSVLAHNLSNASTAASDSGVPTVKEPTKNEVILPINHSRQNQHFVLKPSRISLPDKQDNDSGLSVDGSSEESEIDFPVTQQNVQSDSDDPGQESDTEEDIINKFSFDAQPDLQGHPGPSPSVILQALTMSNANDGINLERLETIGDSFLKYAITTYLYCTYDNIHEGKLSHLRSKQVSNLNLYRLGRRKVFGESMIATKFEPHDNWLPPCYYVPRELEQALIEAGVPASHWNQADLPALRDLSRDEICELVRERSEKLRKTTMGEDGLPEEVLLTSGPYTNIENLPCFIPYNLITQHSIPDKSVADCVEALIGAYLIACGPRGALLFMAWLGICVLPKEEVIFSMPCAEVKEIRPVGSTTSVQINGDNTETSCLQWKQVRYGNLKPPRSPLLRNVSNPEAELRRLLDGYDVFERRIRYKFRDRSYLLQSLTHASYSPNRLTDCYQRLEFLGDAVLDYLITRHLYEDSRQHSPGALTDLRSALVNNTIFASLAVRYGFHKYFRHLSPGLNEVVDRFVRIQEENGHTISEELLLLQYYLIEEEECEEAEDVEVPKALGDVFESVAGAIFLDSGMSLDAVWRVYYRMMKSEIEQFSTNVPKSPIRELLELEPETAKFGKPEKLADGRRVRVTVEVFGKGTFKGIGRNYRIAKCTAAKCALKQLKKKGLLSRKM
ncbi:Endoribonuclease Dcr-1 [Blattella germanica]|nr:Endoribonuclease Dcr-1 [Blattella germanica]